MLNPTLARRWRRLCDELHDPHFELDAEAFAALLSVYKQLRADGYRFDPAIVAILACLERQAADTLEAFEDDTDSDIDDDHEALHAA